MEIFPGGWGGGGGAPNWTGLRISSPEGRLRLGDKVRELRA